MAEILDNVGADVVTTGTGDVVADTAISDAYFTPSEAGAVSGETYYWKLSEGADFEFFTAPWLESGSIVQRSSGTVISSKIGGVAGASHMNLAGSAQLRVPALTELFDLLLRVDRAQSFTAAEQQQAQANMGLALAMHGRCRLVLSGGNLVLSPYDGNTLIIDGAVETIPDAGVSLAPPATDATLYYIYAYMSGGTMTLEASDTTHATQAGTGVEIKSGDSTRSLVGMAYTVSSAWVDTAQQRLVASWFNRRERNLHGGFSTNRSTVSTSIVEINSEIRASFLVWAGDDLFAYANQSPFLDGVGNVATSVIGLDGVATILGGTFSGSYAASVSLWGSFNGVYTGASEGFHYITLGGSVSSGTGTWQASSTYDVGSIGGKVSI
jgi:hypothetical protein